MTTVLKMLDLFCGTKSMAKAFERAGWETYTIDWDEQFSSLLVDNGYKSEIWTKYITDFTDKSH